MLVYSPLDLNKNELRNPQVHNLAAAPGTPVKGQLYMNTGDNTLYFYDGTAWVSTRGAGTPPDATTSTKGLIQLAGDLGGTAASPQIAAGVITDAEVAAANKDGAVGVPSMRTIGNSGQQAMAGNANLSNLLPPTVPLDMNGLRVANVGPPIVGSDATTKTYVDNFIQGLDAKQSVRAASTANVNVATASLATTIDGVTPAGGDRMLLKNQTNPQENGIYGAQAGPGWGRVSDMDAWTEVPGAFVWVEQGATQQDTGWVCTSDQGGTLGTTAITWTQFSGAGSITDGIGLLKTGNTLDVRLDNATVEAPADIVQVKDLGITGAKIANATIDPNTKLSTAVPVGAGGTGAGTAGTARLGLAAAGYYSSATHGAGTTIAITQGIHGLRGTRGIMVQCRIEATGEEIMVDSLAAANGDVTITFAQSQAANTIRVILVG